MFGTLEDYTDLANAYNAGELTFKEFSELCKIRSEELNPRNKNIFDHINKKVISNT